MKNILFFNHKVKNCGVYQYGVRLYDILKKSSDVCYIYREIDCFEEYQAVLSETENTYAIIYNYHCSTMSWLTSLTIQKNVKNIGIPHESPNDLFDILCNIDPNEPDNNKTTFSIPRPIYENVEEIIKNSPVSSDCVAQFIYEDTDSNIPIFGSFGFGFLNKGFYKIVDLINNEFDNAVIKFVIPIAHFDPDNETVHRMREFCINANRKPGIKLMIMHEFLTTEEILLFLSKNTMNIFLYDHMEGRGISSAIDYAISAKRPIGISDSCMFRNVYSDSVCLYKSSIQDCMNNSERHFSTFLEKYNHNNVINRFIYLLDTIYIHTMNIEVSVGEAIDKYNILEIKSRKIKDESKNREIQKELRALDKCKDIIYKNNEYYNWLTVVNTKIWEFTDIIKNTPVADPSFAIISNEIFEENQKRFRIKSFFNILVKSNIQEQKSYASSHCRICIPSAGVFYSKIAEINSLSITYDYLSFDIPFDPSFLSTIKAVFNQPNILYDHAVEPTVILQLEHYNIGDLDKTAFEKKPFTYVCGGLLGDFVQSLSVVYENFLKTGRKGIVYITNDKGGDPFRNGVEKTYQDVKDVVSNQVYIKEFSIYKNQPFDVNLNDWRHSNALYNRFCWYGIYKDVYGVEWGTHPWLTVPADETWKDKVLINTVSYRFPSRIDFKKLYDVHGASMIFVGYNNDEYEHFKRRTGLDIPYYESKSFSEICTIIRSCKLITGSASAPMSIANAFHKDRIIGLGECPRIDIRRSILKDVWSNVVFCE
jgi:hypothetical protein